MVSGLYSIRKQDQGSGGELCPLQHTTPSSRPYRPRQVLLPITNVICHVDSPIFIVGSAARSTSKARAAGISSVHSFLHLNGAADWFFCTAFLCKFTFHFWSLHIECMHYYLLHFSKYLSNTSSDRSSWWILATNLNSWVQLNEASPAALAAPVEPCQTIPQETYLLLPD